MIRKIINLSNYVCNANNWYVATQSIWPDMQNENARLRRWINPPPIQPLSYFFRIDAGAKGWNWTPALESCYGFLITYYADPNLIILTASEPGGSEVMENENGKSGGNSTYQPGTPGMIPINLNIPILAEFDKLFSDFLDSLGLGIPTWIGYVILGTLVYIKIK